MVTSRAARIALFALCLLFILPSAVAAVEIPLQPYVTEFRPGVWIVSPRCLDAGYKVSMDATDPQTGQTCARLEHTGPRPEVFCNLMQVIDAKPYQNKRIRFSAKVKAQVAGYQDRGQLWLRVDRPKKQRGFADNMADRPITESQWQTYEIVGDVAADAVWLNLGVFLVGQGQVLFSEATLEILGDVISEDQPAKALTDRGLANLEAFARLAGYVRFFHPSDEAADADWVQLFVAAVDRVEPAQDAVQLARILEDVFQPIAPTVRVFPAGSKVPIPTEVAQRPANAEPGYLSWLHVGVGLGGDDVTYSSQRVNGAEETTLTEIPEPGAPLRVDLGSGVSALVPGSLYTTADGTWPAAQQSPIQWDRSETWIPSGQDRATRLTDVVMLWTVMQHFYPYFQSVDTDWDAVLTQALQTAATDSGDAEFLSTLRTMVAALHDGHGRVHHGGLLPSHGLPLLWDWIEDQLVIVHMAPGSGDDLRAGDVVVQIDGRPVAEVLAKAEALVSGATPQWIRYRALQELRAGDRGTFVQLGVRRGNAAVHTVTVPRNVPLWSDQALSEPRPKAVEETRPGIYYVDLSRVTKKQLEAWVPDFEKAQGLVFDLRGYVEPGMVSILAHLTTEAMVSPQWHVPEVVLPDQKDLLYRVSNWPLRPKKPTFKAKSAFLVDGRTLSGAETFVSLVENFKLGPIVGQATAGTNGNINPFELPGGYRIIWTGMRVLKHRGLQHHGFGTIPTVKVQRTIAGVTAGRDEILEQGLKLVEGR